MKLTDYNIFNGGEEMSRVQHEKTELENVIDYMPVLIIITDENLIVRYDNIPSY